MRLNVLALEQRTSDLLDPLRLNGGDAARVELAGFDQFSCDHPLTSLFVQRRAGEDPELVGARALVLAGGVGLDADVAEQARQQRAVDLLEAARLLVLAQAGLGEHGVQLAVDIAPLPEAERAQEALLAVVGELAVRLFVLELLLVPVPQLEQAHEIGALVGKGAVGIVSGVGTVTRPLARVLHGERAGDDQHLLQTLLVTRGQDEPADRRVEREARHLLAQRGDLARLVDRAKLLQLLVAVVDGAAGGRLKKRESIDVAEPQRGHAQDHRSQRRARDLGIGKGWARLIVVFVVETDAHACRHPPAPASALVGRRLAHTFGEQHLDLGAVAVAVDPRQTGVDHIAHPRHGERGLGDVGREHDAPRPTRLEHAVLLSGRESCIERQNLGAGRMVLAQRLGGLADLALAGEEDQHIAVADAGEFVHRVDDALDDRLGAVLRILGQRPVAHFNRVRPARDFDHRCAVEVLAETLGINGRRRNNHLEVWPALAQALQIPQQKIDVEAALVRLVDEQRAVGAQVRVGARLGQQDTVGHHLEPRTGLAGVGEAHLEANQIGILQLDTEATGDGARGNAAWLGAADQAWPTRAAIACRLAVGRLRGYGHLPLQGHLQRHLGQLRGLAGAGLTADDHHLPLAQRGEDLVAALGDREVFGVIDGDRSGFDHGQAESGAMARGAKYRRARNS